jgi:zinc transporter 1
VIVGSLGLASNIVGLFLFQEHGHSHGHSHKHSTPSSSASSEVHVPTNGSLASGSVTPTQKQSISVSPSRPHHSPMPSSFSSLYGHPVATRASLVQTANEIASAQSSPTPHYNSLISLDSPSVSQNPVSESSQPNEISTENTPLLHDEDGHKHKHIHTEGSMNMRALVLHVVGDALGNVGVILTGLIIWLTTWQYKFYCDPIISLIITVIIFSNSLPLGMIFFITLHINAPKNCAF